MLYSSTIDKGEEEIVAHHQHISCVHILASADLGEKFVHYEGHERPNRRSSVSNSQSIWNSIHIPSSLPTGPSTVNPETLTRDLSKARLTV